MLEKTCNICGETLPISRYKFNRRGKYKGSCEKCLTKKRKYATEPILDKKSVIKVRGWNTDGKKHTYKIPPEKAQTLVDDGMAKIVNSALIHKIYTNKEFRAIVFARDRYRCYYCNEPANTIDHIIPKSKKGISSFKNCVACCKACNKLKASMDLELFLFTYEPSVWKGTEDEYAEEKMEDIQAALGNIEEYLEKHLAVTLVAKRRSKRRRIKKLKRELKQTKKTIKIYNKEIRKANRFFR